MKSPIRIAIAQPPMFWTTAENTRQIIRSLHLAAQSSADVCVFPELALTGFHRNIKIEAKPALIDPALRQVREACALLQVAAVVGTPSFDEKGRVFNSVEFVDETGLTRALVSKSGITPVEATFFERGVDRPIVALKNFRSTAIVCREAHDVDAISAQLPRDSVDVVFWPGIMRPDPSRPGGGEPHVVDAALIAKRLNAFIVQSNWPNSLNYPEEGKDSGHSIVISPKGEMLMRLPKAMPGIGVFNLGESSFTWTPT